MQYYSEVQEKEEGCIIVSREKRVLGINKTARFRVNIPDEMDYNRLHDPYAVEEKVGRSWVKIGILAQRAASKYGKTGA